MNSQANSGKKFHIHTLGCKVNQYESQAMRELLVKAGFEESENKNTADIYIVNTCTVTQEADRQSKNVTGQFHKTNPNARIVVTGCMVEKDAPEFLAMPGVSSVLKNSDKNRIAQSLGGDRQHGPQKQSGELVVSDFKGHSKAFVKIQDGCENRCSYCKVPLVRPVLRSKPIEEIVGEVRGLVMAGFKEIVLTGICLGAWGEDLRAGRIAEGGTSESENLVDVLRSLDGVGGEFRIRLSSIEPKYVTDELIKFMAQEKRMCAHLHIPFQSGDDDILKLMNRPYTSAEYRSTVDNVRAAIPRIALTTDILVGFPGESDERFMNTMDFVRGIAPSRTHIFTFSRRAGTSAYDMSGVVDRSVMKGRYDSMSVMTLEAADTYRRSFLGDHVNVLVETRRDKATGLLKGYSDNYIQMLFAGPDDLMRSIVPVRVTGFDAEKTIGILTSK